MTRPSKITAIATIDVDIYCDIFDSTRNHFCAENINMEVIFSKFTKPTPSLRLVVSTRKRNQQNDNGLLRYYAELRKMTQEDISN